MSLLTGKLSLESENPVQNKVITQEFEDVKGMRGSETGYGMVKLSAASDVTESMGLALPSSEKNAALEGTMAHEISSLKDGFANIGKESVVVLTGSPSANVSYTFPQSIALDRGGVYLIMFGLESLKGALIEAGIRVDGTLIRAFRSTASGSVITSIPQGEGKSSVSITVTTSANAGYVSDVRFNSLRVVRIK